MLLKIIVIALIALLLGSGSYLISQKFISKPGPSPSPLPSPVQKISPAPTATASLTPTPLPASPAAIPVIDESSRNIQKDGCFVTGCSGEICSDEMLLTTCGGPQEMFDEIACLKGLTCERQSNGECGFTLTPEYHACMKKVN